jgi:hypothetical protein
MAYQLPSPSKQFPPACRHQSHYLLHFWNASCKSFSVSVSSTSMNVGPCHHGMVRPQVVGGGTASNMEGHCE